MGKADNKLPSTRQLNEEMEAEMVINSANKGLAPVMKHAGGRPKSLKPKKKVELRIDPELYDTVSIVAEMERRSTNSMICEILHQYINSPENKEAILEYLKSTRNEVV